MPKNIVVIGAGLGGLTSAALLAQKGHKVTVLEQGDWIGGKSRRIEVAGQVIDTGPSLFTFPGVWETFLAKYQELGGKLPKDLEFIRLAEVGRYFFRGDQIDIPVPESHQWHKPWQKFVAQHKSLEGPITTLLTSAPMDLKALPALGKLLNVYGTRLSTNNYLNSLSWMPEGLKDLIAIHTLNAGVSPDQTLPIYASMTAIMSEQGISVPRGGMNEVPQLLAKLAEESGAEILLGQRVISISKHAVKTQERNYNADVVVSSLGQDRTKPLLLWSCDLCHLEKTSSRWHRHPLGCDARRSSRSVSGAEVKHCSQPDNELCQLLRAWTHLFEQEGNCCRIANCPCRQR
jgi:phytoene desaturase